MGSLNISNKNIYDQIILGGGVIGLLTAYELALQGCRVALVDKQLFGQESSWSGGGICSPLYPWRHPSCVSRMSVLSQTLYPKLINSLKSSTGIDSEYCQSGLLIKSLADEAAAIQWSKKYQWNIEVKNTNWLAHNHSYLNINDSTKKNAPWLWLPDIYQLRNPRFIKALVLYLTNCSNVDLFPNTKNQYWEINNKKIINLKTEHGNLKANQYIAAAGAWTNSITSQWGVVVPIEPVHGQMLLMQPPEDTDIKTIILSDGYYLIPRACGRIIIGSTMVMKGFCKRVDASTQNILLQQACKMVPSLSRGELIAQWSGLRPGMKSGIPWLGRLKNLSNAYIHAGHFRNGLVLAPASARLMRQILLKQKTTIDVNEYQPSNSHDLNQLEKEK